MTARDIGFVYVLSNPAMPGIVKVGYTTQLADDRASRLFTTAIPVKFQVELRLVSSHPQQVEREAHRRLADFRIADNREFFRCDAQDAIAAVRLAASTIDGLRVWTKRPIHRVRAGDHLIVRLRARQMFVLVAYPNLSAGSAELIDIWQAHSDGDSLEIHGTSDSSAVAGLSDGDVGCTIDPVPYLNRTEDALNDLINGKERLVPGDRLIWLDAGAETGACVSTVFETDSYCQLISRTHNPVCSSEGWPLLVNHLTVALPTEMHSHVRGVLALPFPDAWAPRNVADRDQWTEIGTAAKQPEYWLRPLARTRRGSQR